MRVAYEPLKVLGNPVLGDVSLSTEGDRLCGTSPCIALLDMRDAGGRYPLGVPLLSGRSSQHLQKFFCNICFTMRVTFELLKVPGDHLKKSRKPIISHSKGFDNGMARIHFILYTLPRCRCSSVLKLRVAEREIEELLGP